MIEDARVQQAAPKKRYVLGMDRDWNALVWSYQGVDQEYIYDSCYLHLALENILLLRFQVTFHLLSSRFLEGPSVFTEFLKGTSWTPEIPRTRCTVWNILQELHAVWAMPKSWRLAVIQTVSRPYPGVHQQKCSTTWMIEGRLSGLFGGECLHLQRWDSKPPD